MSGVARTTGGGRLSRVWQRWRFHLNALLILIPVLAFPGFLATMRMFAGDAGLGAREAGVVAIGPDELRLAEFDTEPPIDRGLAGPRKVMTLALCEGCDGHIRAVYARIGKPRSLRAAGAIFMGSPGRLSADIPVPPRASAGDGLWITVEYWDGSSASAEMPLETASPALARWIGRNGDNS